MKKNSVDERKKNKPKPKMTISDEELGMCLNTSGLDGEEVPICFCGYTAPNYVNYINDVT
jgi:hypothetical protein